MIDDKEGITKHDIYPKYSWTYKAPSGLYWSLKVKRFTGFNGELDNDVDWSWGYKIFFEDRLLYRGCIRGFLEIVPDPEEFFLDFQYQLGKIIIGVSKYAIPDPFTIIPRGEGPDREDQRSEKDNAEIDKDPQRLDQDQDQALNPTPTAISREISMGVVEKPIRRKTIKRKTPKSIS